MLYEVITRLNLLLSHVPAFAHELLDRITSYNVCYTKLLRPGDGAPGIVALAVGEPGMEDGNPPAPTGEAGPKPPDQLRREGDLGDQDQRRATPRSYNFV